MGTSSVKFKHPSIYLPGQTRAAAQLLDWNCSTSSAEKNSIHTLGSLLMSCQGPASPGPPGDSLPPSPWQCAFTAHSLAHVAQPLGSHHSGLCVGGALAAFISSNGQEGWAQAETPVLRCRVLPAFSVSKESRQGFTGSSAWALTQAAVKVSAWAAVLFEGSPGEGAMWSSFLWCWQHSVPRGLSSYRR